MTKDHHLKTRKQSDIPLGLSLNFLLGCSQDALDDYALARLAEISDARKEVYAVMDRFMQLTAQSIVAEWFRKADRDSINHDLATEESPLEWAKRKISEGQRSKEELEEGEFLPGLPLGAAHLAAALRYQERNIAEGKCRYCPKPLDRNSVSMCVEHLAKTRHRAARKAGVKGDPGSADYLYGEITESTHGRQPGSLAALEMNREKKTRALLADMGIPPESAAVSLKAAKDALLKLMLDSKAQTAAELVPAALIPSKETGRKALIELLSEGKIQRTGKGVDGNPYRYFLAQETKLSPAENDEGRNRRRLSGHSRF